MYKCLSWPTRYPDQCCPGRADGPTIGLVNNETKAVCAVRNCPHMRRARSSQVSMNTGPTVDIKQ